MAFMIEKIMEKDVPFFNALGIKDWTGNHPKIIIPGRTTWCIDREKNAFFMRLGGGRADEPYISVFWWDGLQIRMEEELGVNKTTDGKIIRTTLKLLTPPKAYDKKNEIAQFVLEALMAIQEQDDISLGKDVIHPYEKGRNCEVILLGDDYMLYEQKPDEYGELIVSLIDGSDS